VAARYLTDAPTHCARLRHPKIERLAWVTRRPDVTLVREALARSRKCQLLEEAFERLRRALRIYPRAVLFVDIKIRSGPGWYGRFTISLRGQESVPARRRLQIDHRLSGLGKERIEHHERRYRFFQLLGDAGNHHAAIGVSDQHHVIQRLPLHFIDDIENVGVEVDVGCQQMRALGQARMILA
jgi:hypothetical protein